MKRRWIFLAAALLLLISCGCSSSGQSSGPSGQQESAASGSAEKKVLVAYFSATGSTRTVAEEIAKDTGGTLFEITPVESYTPDDLSYNNPQSRVSQEHKDPESRDVALMTAEVPDWSSYTTVFVGYPIWWGEAAYPAETFVKANDFSGKTVIPFCTSSSSPIGESGEKLKEDAGTGNWEEGKRFSSGASREEVREWVDSLNLSST